MTKNTDLRIFEDIELTLPVELSFEKRDDDLHQWRARIFNIEEIGMTKTQCIQGLEMRLRKKALLGQEL